MIVGYSVLRKPLSEVLKACGDNLTRENIMKQAASIKDLQLRGRACLVSRSIPARLTLRLYEQLPQLQKFKGRTFRVVRPRCQRRHRRLI